MVLPISIHTALAGCDKKVDVRDDDGLISIHTALAGCDWMGMENPVKYAKFQSTQPSQAVTIITKFGRSF